jgi:hypothetical protein
MRKATDEEMVKREVLRFFNTVFIPSDDNGKHYQQLYCLITIINIP